MHAAKRATKTPEITSEVVKHAASFSLLAHLPLPGITTEGYFLRQHPLLHNVTSGLSKDSSSSCGCCSSLQTAPNIPLCMRRTASCIINQTARLICFSFLLMVLNLSARRIPACSKRTVCFHCLITTFDAFLWSLRIISVAAFYLWIKAITLENL